MSLQNFNFGSGTVYLLPQGVGVSPPIQCGTLQEVSLDFDWSDKGLQGRNDIPAAIARGALKITGKFKAANFRIADINASIFNSNIITGTTNVIENEGQPNGIQIPASVTLATSTQTTTGDVLTFTDTTGVVIGQAVTGTNIPANTTVTAKTSTTVTLSNAVSGTVASAASIVFGPSITVAQAATFLDDLGVLNATTGAQLTKVSSSPGTGEYTVTNGIYTFSSDDVGGYISPSYSYSQTEAGSSITYYGQPMGPRPSFRLILSNKAFFNNPAYAGQPTTCILYNAGINKFSLDFKNEDWMIPESDFSVSADFLNRVLTMSSDS